MKSGTCPKCSGSNIAAARHFRAQGIGSKADMNLLTCNDCRYSEMYEMDDAESGPVRQKMAMIWFFAVILPMVLAVGSWIYFSYL